MGLQFIDAVTWHRDGWSALVRVTLILGFICGSRKQDLSCWKGSVTSLPWTYTNTSTPKMTPDAHEEKELPSSLGAWSAANSFLEMENLLPAVLQSTYLRIHWNLYWIGNQGKSRAMKNWTCSMHKIACARTELWAQMKTNVRLFSFFPDISFCGCPPQFTQSWHFFVSESTVYICGCSLLFVDSVSYTTSLQSVQRNLSWRSLIAILSPKRELYLVFSLSKETLSCIYWLYFWSHNGSVWLQINVEEIQVRGPKQVNVYLLSRAICELSFHFAVFEKGTK